MKHSNLNCGAYYTPETTISSENKRELTTIAFCAEGQDVTV